jgi:bisanhydrobacterioruberin hydratase
LKGRQSVLILVLAIFYSVGTLGICFGNKAFFLSLSPWNLLLSIVILLFSYKKLTAKTVGIFFLIATAGFIAELIGVKTALLFGDYSYGKNLGFKLFDVPLIIAVNWLMLSLVSISLFLKLPLPKWGLAILSASLMTLLDFLIEPVAINSDFWSWTGGNIPIYNYICWWIIAFPLHFLLLKKNVVEQNKVSIGLLIILFLFFGILNLV